MKRNYFILYLMFIISSCQSLRFKNSNLVDGKGLIENGWWQHAHFDKDSIVGISLDKVYGEILNKKKSSKIVIALLDSYIDLKNPDFKEFIWENKIEIPDNKIDDDHNGYIDDIHGWNFMGNNKGDCVAYLNTDATRMIKFLLNKHGDSIFIKKNKKDSILFKKASEFKRKSTEQLKYYTEANDYYKSAYPSAQKRIEAIFPSGKYSLKEIDSISSIHKDSNDSILKGDLYFMRSMKEYNLDAEYFKKFNIKITNWNNYTENPNYEDRKIIGDDENNLEFNNYGNPYTWKLPHLYSHSTYMAGVIVGNRNNKLGAKGVINNNVKLMPISLMPDEGIMTDKDIYYAIKYSVDNGAKVINMSFGKLLPIYPHWIKEAILYAEKKDVLLVVSAGNDAKNVDTFGQYPNDYEFDYFYKGEEFCNNLIVVAGNAPIANASLVYELSNYGKLNVDVFAPAKNVKTVEVYKGEHIGEGTSYSAALTSGVAALLRSYYPEFTAAQVKQILMDSSVKFDLMVQVPGEKEGVLKPFRELSKSGGVLNAYNAFKLAEQLSKGQKK